MKTVNDSLGGCSATATIQVVSLSQNPVVASAFSPNQYGVNDYLMPQGLIN